MQRHHLGKIQLLSLEIFSLFFKNGISNGNAHGRDSQLRLDCTVSKLYRRMDNALPLNDNLDFFNRNMKKNMGFQNFQGFIHHGSGIYGNLSSHRPVGML